MKIDWWTLGLQTLNALVLIWLLLRFLFQPVANIFTARQKAVEQVLADAQAARTAAESERAKAEAEATRLAEHRNEALKAVEAEVEAERAALLAAARAEAEKIHAAAEAEIAAERCSEAAAADDRAGQLAVDIAAKLLDRLPGDARIAGFIDGIAKGLSTLPEGMRAALGANGTPIHLTAARTLTAQEGEACRRALAGILGRPVTVDVSVDPALIAGLELQAPEAAVRNSFRADLISIKSKLVNHDKNLA